MWTSSNASSGLQCSFRRQMTISLNNDRNSKLVQVCRAAQLVDIDVRLHVV